MKKSKITFEPATTAHAKKFYGDKCAKSFKGHVAMLDGKVVGIGGLSYEQGRMVLFSDMKEEFRPFKKDIWKAIDILGEMVEKTNCPVVAVANNKEKNAEFLLTKLGFTPNGESTPDGKIFWRFP
ncbi:hypothetical protein KAR48_20265 [bacterium]|nr:hypothetical protein [bacterium]